MSILKYRNLNPNKVNIQPKFTFWLC